MDVACCISCWLEDGETTYMHAHTDIKIIIHTYSIILHVAYFLRPYTSALNAWQWKWNGAPEPAQMN